MSARRSGRRPGESGTREAILAAALRQFSAHGYDRTSMRAVAADAGVDQKLVSHFFGSKQQLFVASLALPIDPQTIVPGLIAGPRREIGARIANVLFAILEEPGARDRMTSLLRAAATEPEAARMVREFVIGEVWTPVADALQVEQAPLRISLLGSQVVGLVMARYVLGIEPLASAPAETIAAVLAPTFQRYLVGALPAD